VSVSRETVVASVSRETEERLNAFTRLLLAWNDKINLISRGDAPLLKQRHVDDSLQLARLIPAATNSAIDLGSGAGFPGLILAIATNIPFTLIEADARKAAFLREAARVTEASVTVLTTRIEASNPPKADLITSRALAPLPRLLDLATPHLAPGGTLLLLKGANADSEVAAAKSMWTMHVERHISQISQHGVVLRITGVQRA
jgi:16S rRNA (guanine527-N7)-methyltransferase